MKYWINIDGIQRGPLSYEELAEMTFNPEETYVWYNGLDDWHKISDVAELGELAASAAERYGAEMQGRGQESEAERPAAIADEDMRPEQDEAVAAEESDEEIVDVQPTGAEIQPQEDAQAVHDDRQHIPSAGAVPPPLPRRPVAVPPVPVQMPVPRVTRTPYQEPQHESKRQPTYLGWAVVVTLLCCQITGVISLVYAALASSANSDGAYDKAKSYSETAQTWIMVSIALGLVYMPVAILFVIMTS